MSCMENREFATQMQIGTKRYALSVIELVDALPKTTTGRVIGHQLIRAGTSVGANYRAACRARSTAEFSAKLGIVIEEADECIYWIELIVEGKLMRGDLLQPLLQETNELLATMVTARKTVQQHHS